MLKRVTVFSGHYGSGKTNLAVNFAIGLKKQGFNVGIYDLDFVNPYFRTIDAKKLLLNAGVDLTVSDFAETNVDLPSVKAESYRIIADKEKYAVVDLGGDDSGALAMGRFSEELKKENNVDFLLVFNAYRPETNTVEGVIQIISEIENACKMRFTGIINNSNLGENTTEQDVLNSLPLLNQVSKKSGLPVKFTAVLKNLEEKLKGKIQNLFPVELIKYGDWL